MKVTHRIVGLAETATSLALGGGLAAVLAADTAVTAAKHDNWAFELAVGAIVCATALLRGRGPVLAAAAGLAVCGLAGVAGDVYRLPSQPGVAASLGLLVLGAAAVRVAPVRTAMIITAAGVVVMVAGRAAIRTEDIAPIAFVGVLAWGVALIVGAWRRIGDARRELAIDAARRGERLELARELHDVVAHYVAGIVVQAQAARLVAARRPAEVDGMLTGIESAGNDALAAMRRVVGLLRDPGDAAGLAPGKEQLSDLVGRFAGHGPAVRLNLPDGEQPPWPPEVATTVYRVVQEALTNIVLHASDATSVTVVVDGAPSGVSVEVTNDAPAGPPAKSGFASGGGHGLVGMRERVEALGGSLHAGPDPGRGWAVRATVPLTTGPLTTGPLPAGGTP
ncbi:MAG: sensor histidine kinase [Trebonia sp.]